MKRRIATLSFLLAAFLAGPVQAGDPAMLYKDNCASCHGDNGKGNLELGAPNLTDKIWLYGSDEAALVETITHLDDRDLLDWRTFERVRTLLGDVNLTFRLPRQPGQPGPK